MTKQWELVEAEARRLYPQGVSLEQLRKRLRQTHNFDACKRSWLLKIKEWGIQKQRPPENPTAIVLRESERCNTCRGKIRQQEPHEIDSVTPDGADGQDVERSRKRRRITDEGASILAAPPGPVDSAEATLANDVLFSRLEFALEYDENRVKQILHEANFVSGTPSFLHFVVRRGRRYENRRCRTVIDYMKENGHSLNILDERGQTALEISIKSDNYYATFELIEADPTLLDVRPAEEGLLHLAIRYGSAYGCCKLIPLVRDFNEQDIFGQTPLKLAARQGHSQVVRRLLYHGALIGDWDEKFWIDLLFEVHRGPRPFEVMYAVLDEGFSKSESSEAYRHACMSITTIVLDMIIDDEYSNDRQIRLYRMLHHLLQNHFPALMEASTGYLVSTFQSRVQRWSMLQDEVLDVARDCQRIFVQQGFKPCSGQRYPYSDDEVTKYPGVSYTYAKTCVETCDLSVYGQGLFEFLEYLFEDPLIHDEYGNDMEDEERWWSGAGKSKLAGLLQILVDRGLHLDNGINLLSFVLSKVPDEHHSQKLNLMRSLMRSRTCKSLECCTKYGFPLGLLANARKPSLWQYAEILLTRDVLSALGLGDTVPWHTASAADLGSNVLDAPLEGYTTVPHMLQQGILHVITKRAMTGLSVSSDDLREILSIRKEFDLPELTMNMDSSGRLTLPKYEVDHSVP